MAKWLCGSKPLGFINFKGRAVYTSRLREFQGGELDNFEKDN